MQSEFKVGQKLLITKIADTELGNHLKEMGLREDRIATVYAEHDGDYVLLCNGLLVALFGLNDIEVEAL